MSHSHFDRLQPDWHDRNLRIIDWQFEHQVASADPVLTDLPCSPTPQTIFGRISDSMVTWGDRIVTEVEAAASLGTGRPALRCNSCSSAARGVFPVAVPRESLAPVR